MKHTTIQWRTISDIQCTLGEAPTWDHRTGTLWWVDGWGNTVYAFRDGDAAPIRSWDAGRFAIGIILTPGTEPWVVTADSVRTLNGDPAPGVPEHLLTDAGFDPSVYRFNDSFVASSDLLVAGVMAWKPADATGAFLAVRGARVAAGGESAAPAVSSVSTVSDGVRLSNGIGLSPEADVMYLTDSLSRTIYRARFSAADGTIGHLEPFIDTSERPGLPDGMAVATDGTVFSARWGGAAIDRYDPAGTLAEVLPVPMTQPSCVTFGGPDMRTLFVTSATEHMTQSEISPADGTTIAGTVEVAGLKERVWGAGASG